MIEDRPSSEEIARLTTLRLFGVLDSPVEALLDRITALAATLFDVPFALITLIDDTRQQMASAYGVAPVDLPRETAFCDHTIRGDDVLVVSDMLLDARFKEHEHVTDGLKVRFYAGAPLIAPDGAKLGAMCILDRRPRSLSSLQIEMLEQLAKLVMEHFALGRESRGVAAERNRFEAIIHASPNAMLTTTLDGAITSWNEGAERIFGWTREEVIGKISPALVPELLAQTAELRERVGGGETVMRMRSYRITKSGERIDVEITGAPVRGLRGEVVEGGYMFEDVTALVRERTVERNRYEILEIAANDGPIQDLLDRLVANLELAIPGTIASLLRVRAGRVYHAASGKAMPRAFMASIDGAAIGPEVGSCGAAAFLNEMVIAGTIATHPNWEPYRESALASGLAACWSVPVRIASGVIATLACYAHHPRLPSESDLRALHEAAHLASIVLEGHDARVRLQEMAMHDALTDLPNRTLFEERMRVAIDDAKRSNKRVGIGLLDLDRFKIVNDNLGHAVGDQLLQEVASRLQRALRPQDTVARMGGDEFLLLISNVEDRRSAYEIGERSLSTLEKSFAPGGHELFVRGSLGLSIYPDDALEPSQLLRLADQAMYEAKAGGSSIVAHDGSQESDGLTQLALETYLNHALEKNEFELEFQPIVHLEDGTVYSAETLLRWNHPTLGRLGPDRFITLAEDTGLIIPIGTWLLNEACRFSRRWSLAGGCGRVNVHVSARQFEDRGFVSVVADAVRRTGIPPSDLILEITERLIMRSPESVSDTLAELRALGIRSVIDDFGSGYSSLSYLKRFPIQALKIDRGFVREIVPGEASASDEAIIRAIVAIGAALDLVVVAEGVETQHQADFLRSAGCAFAQGFHYARPLAPDELIAWSAT